MAYSKILNYAFNRGVISPLALARFDLKRLALSAQVCVNWMFRTLGSMMLRPGLQFIDTTYENTSLAVHIPFIFSITDTAILELTDFNMRVRVDEEIVTFPAVGTSIVNGDPFVSGLTGWTVSNDPAGSATESGGNLLLSGNLVGRGLVYQEVTVASGDLGVLQAIIIDILKGYVTLRVGSSVGADDYIEETTLNVGQHVLSLTPTGNFYVQFSSATEYTSIVEDVGIYGAGDLILSTPWPENMLGFLRWDQSADVLFVTSDGSLPQMRIERRSTTSWSVVNYYADDGPFQNQNVDPSNQLTPSALFGDITLTSNVPFFNNGHIGCLFALQSQTGSEVESNVAGVNQFTDPIEVTGVGAQRNFYINISGTWSGSVSLETSVGAPGAWILNQKFTTNQINTLGNDGFDNTIVYWRLGFESGDYISGTADCSLSFSQPSGNKGIIRIDSISNDTEALGHVLPYVNNTTGGTVHIDSTSATSLWSQGIWNGNMGYPSAVAFYEGRLWWCGQDYIMGSVSDAYASYDQTVSGDSGPIVRTIAQGPVSIINWILGLQRLLVGCDGAEQSVRSDSLDDPLTPTNFNIKSPSTRGSCSAAAVKIDTNGVYIQRGDPDEGNVTGTRLIQIAYQGVYAIIDYTTSDLSEFCPELLAVGVVKIAVQRKIDTRIHCLLLDGTVAVCVYDPVENEKGFTLISSPGNDPTNPDKVIDLFVMPGAVEDKVYYVVKRTTPYPLTFVKLERWALESQCVGGNINLNLDSFTLIQNGSPSTAISVPDLGLCTVCVWADGVDVGTNADGEQIYTLDISGNATLAAPATNVVVGLPYTAQFQSVKLTQTVHDGTTLGYVKNVDRLGLVLANTHAQGLQYGKDFDSLDPLPLVEDGEVVPANTVWANYDKDTVPFDGSWDADSRVCLQAQAPRPCTVLSMNIGVDAGDS